LIAHSTTIEEIKSNYERNGEKGCAEIVGGKDDISYL